MAQIVLVHGIAQEQRSAAELEAEWTPSLVGGLENAGHPGLAKRVRTGEFTIRMAFYGNQFLTPDHQGAEADALTADGQSAADELAVELLRNAAGSVDLGDAREARIALAALLGDRPDTQGVIKSSLVRVAGALDRLPWFGRGALSASASVKRTLTQVTRYLGEPAIRAHAINAVSEHLDDETRVVIGHSLGSVAAYETLRAHRPTRPIPLLLTLGSPLGLSAISTRLHPQPPDFPTAVHRWVNIASPDDIVAARPDLHAIFDRGRPPGAVFEGTWKVDNGSKPHQINFYLTKRSCGDAVAGALT